MLTPHYQDEFATIYNGDCREILPQLEPVDLVLTDPPYDQSNSGGGMVAQRPTFQKIGAELSSFEPEGFWNLLMGATKTYHGYIFTSKNCLRRFILLAEAARLSWDLLVYGKNNPAPMKNNRYLSSFENIFFFRGSGCYWNNKAPYECFNKLKIVNCVPSQYGHPTEKSAAVIEELLVVSTKEDHAILDPFMGSGTTLVAAKNLGRKCIGIEIEKKYCDIAVRRLAQCVLPLTGRIKEKL